MRAPPDYEDQQPALVVPRSDHRTEPFFRRSGGPRAKRPRASWGRGTGPGWSSRARLGQRVAGASARKAPHLFLWGKATAHVRPVVEDARDPFVFAFDPADGGVGVPFVDVSEAHVARPHIDRDAPLWEDEEPSVVGPPL